MSHAATEATRTQNPIRLFRKRRALLRGIWFLLVSLGSAYAQTLSQYYHTSWTVRDGAPSNMWNIVQASDGFLWIASDSGLYRFDGVTFYKFQAAEGPQISAGSIESIYTPRSGGVWISYQLGGADFIKDGRVTKYGTNEGLPAGTVMAFAEDQRGVMWAATTHGLEVLQGSRWNLAAHDVYAYPYAADLRETPNGDLYASNGESLQVRRKGDQAFKETGILTSDTGFSSDGTGKIWLDGPKGLREMILPSTGKAIVHDTGLKTPVETALVARDGSLWFTTSGFGLRRIASPLPGFGIPIAKSQIQSFDEARGLSGDYGNRILEDREGSIWVTTSKGLDQFRPTTFVAAPLPSGAIGISVVESQLGILVGTLRDGAQNEPLIRIHDDAFERLAGAPVGVTCLYRDGHGGTWVGGFGHLWKLDKGRFLSIPLPKDLSTSAVPTIQAISVDGEGTLWLSAVRQPVHSFDGHEWKTYPDLHETAVSLFNDKAGRIWFGYVNNKVRLRVNGEVTTFTAANGIDVGNVLVMTERGDHIWFGGNDGVDYFKDGAFHRLLVSGEELSGVSGLVETANGDLWLNQASGVVFIPAVEIRAALSNSQHQTKPHLYDYLDGLQGTPASLRPIPTLFQATSGRLYAPNLTGLVSLDPNKIPHNNIVPTVAIDSMLVDGKQYAPRKDLELTKGLQSMEITYSASSLLIPKKVRFRYKLDGYDKTWQEADTRRQAFYLHLPPGRFTFHVIACNNDGLWSEKEATLEFYVPPTFLESRWFTALWMTTVCLLLGMLFVFRLRQATTRLRMQLHERASERERIARDLHDTFFQSIQGLLLRFQVATMKLSASDPVRQMFEDTLKTSDKVMIEGRELVLDIRTSSVDTEELKRAFTLAGQEFQDFYPSNFQVNVAGRTRRLQLECSEEIYRLGREALSNAFRHAKADEIVVDLNFGRQELKVCIRDNGVGIDPKFVFEGRRPGHWGLPGMKERAEKIGGFVDVRSQLNVGTHIELTVPGSRAYQMFWAGQHHTKRALKGWETDPGI